jgi:hypothetical protein
MHRTPPIRPTGRLRAYLAFLAALGALNGPPWSLRNALAQTTPAPAAAESALAAEIDVGSSGLDAEQVRAAIARELGVDVRLSTGPAESNLRVRLGNGRRATVRFQPPGGRPLERTVELPADPEPAYETVALLAGNLARDEASELLEQLRRKAAPEAEAASEAAGAAETPKPAPTVTVPVPKPKPKKTARPAPKPSTRAADQKDEPPLASGPVNLSVFYPLALYRDSDRRRVLFELGFAYSRVGAINGLGTTLGHLRVHRELEGAAFSLFWNRVERATSGAQFSVGGNLSGGALRGSEFAVGFNDRTGVVNGSQAAVGYNHAPAVKGVQLGVASNHTRELDGAQLALVNSTGAADGVQGGLVNVAGELSGVQLGLVNVGTHVRGVQLGLINIADEVDGASVGILNVVGNARTRLVGWVDSSARGNIGIKYQHAFLFTLISGSYRLNRLTEPEGKFLEPAFAIGGHLDFAPAFVELDAQYAFRQASDEDALEKHISRYRITVGYDPVRSFGGFVGGAVEQRFDRDGGSTGVLGFAGVQFF